MMIFGLRWLVPIGKLMFESLQSKGLLSKMFLKLIAHQFWVLPALCSSKSTQVIAISLMRQTCYVPGDLISKWSPLQSPACPHSTNTLTQPRFSPGQSPYPSNILSPLMSSTPPMSLPLQCPHPTNVLSTISSPVHCLYLTNILTPAMSSPLQCPYPTQPCPDPTNVLTPEMSSPQQCAHRTNILTPDMSSTHQCPHPTNVVTPVQCLKPANVCTLPCPYPSNVITQPMPTPCIFFHPSNILTLNNVLIPPVS